MEVHEELSELKSQIIPILEKAKSTNFQDPIKQIKDAIHLIGKSFCGSSIGYHSKVYYADFQTPPAWAQFSAEWGLDNAMNMGSVGDWCQFTQEDVISHIKELSGAAKIDFAENLEKEAREIFTRIKSETLSILENEIRDSPDKFVEKVLEDIEKLELSSTAKVLRQFEPSGKFWSRDSLAITQGIQTPPHFVPLSKIICIERTINLFQNLTENISKLESYLSRKQKKSLEAERIGTNIFLGHGRSSLWRELKDFIEDRLRLPCDEFNRVPVAGITNIARLSEMLEASAFAFLILTAEDETKEGGVQARMNVIHEVGLFQGRLGFTKAIVLLEEGCAEFSNIQGLGQIRFPKNNIKASFEEIRLVLERENVL